MFYILGYELFLFRYLPNYISGTYLQFCGRGYFRE